MEDAKTPMSHLIMKSSPLPEEYLDHALSGTYEDHRDFHAQGDLVVIYRIDDKEVVFVRINTHSELFGKEKK